MRFKVGFTIEITATRFLHVFHGSNYSRMQTTQNSGLKMNDTVNHINIAGQQKHNIPLESSHFITYTERV